MGNLRRGRKFFFFFIGQKSMVNQCDQTGKSGMWNPQKEYDEGLLGIFWEKVLNATPILNLRTM